MCWIWEAKYSYNLPEEIQTVFAVKITQPENMYSYVRQRNYKRTTFEQFAGGEKKLRNVQTNNQCDYKK